MSFVKRCPGCGGEFREGMDACPDCGEALLWEAEGRGGERAEPGYRDTPADPEAGWGPRQPPLPPSPDLETVVEVDLHDAKALGLRLDRAGLRFRLEMLEPPDNSYSAAFGIPNEAGAYALQVAPRDLTRAEAEWEAYLHETAPPPEEEPGRLEDGGAWGSDAGDAWNSDAPPPIDRRGSSCLGTLLLLILGGLGTALLVPFFV